MPVPNKYLVLCGRNGLFPPAKQLRNEMHPEGDVQVFTLARAYQSSWEGILDVQHAGWDETDGFKAWGKVGEEVMSGERTFITDSWLRRMLDAAQQVPFQFSTLNASRPEPYALAIGAWWDGESFSHHHWFLPDWGLFPGGLGAEVLAGGTLIYHPELAEQEPGRLLGTIAQDLIEKNFRGLVQAIVDRNGATERWEIQSWRGGWPELHTDLFLWQVGPLVVLLNGLPVTAPKKTFTVGTVVSQAPWPYRAIDLDLVTKASKVDKNRLRLKPVTTSMPPEAREHFRFYGMKLEEGRIMTDGVDGRFGVAIVASNLLSLARSQCVQVARTAHLPKQQYRTDVGSRVELFLLGLEKLGLW